MRKCLPYNLSPFIFAPVLNVLFHFMRLESICIGRKQTDLVPNKGTRWLAIFVSNIVFVGYPKLKTPWRSRAGFIWKSQAWGSLQVKTKRRCVSVTKRLTQHAYRIWKECFFQRTSLSWRLKVSTYHSCLASHTRAKAKPINWTNSHNS